MMENTKMVQLANHCYFDCESKILLVENIQVKLTLIQTKILEILVKNLNRPIQNIDIFHDIWDVYEKEFNEKSIRNTISSIRKIVPQIHITNMYGGYYMLRQNKTEPDALFKEYVFEILDQSKTAIAITDPHKPDNPIIYINSAFTELYGYLEDDVVGKNCRFLHGDDHLQIGSQSIKNAVANYDPITTRVRNYSKFGKLIINEVTVSPIFDKHTGIIRYFQASHKDITHYANEIHNCVRTHTCEKFG